jgi:hypothetical protein
MGQAKVPAIVQNSGNACLFKIIHAYALEGELIYSFGVCGCVSVSVSVSVSVPVPVPVPVRVPVSGCVYSDYADGLHVCAGWVGAHVRTPQRPKIGLLGEQSRSGSVDSQLCARYQCQRRCTLVSLIYVHASLSHVCPLCTLLSLIYVSCARYQCERRCKLHSLSSRLSLHL